MLGVKPVTVRESDRGGRQGEGGGGGGAGEGVVINGSMKDESQEETRRIARLSPTAASNISGASVGATGEKMVY